MKTLIGLHGLPGSGKDTAAAAMRDWHAFKPIAFADPLRSMLASALNIDMEHFTNPELKDKVIPWIGLTPRDLMKSIGMWGREQVHPDIWVKVAMQKASGFDRVVLTDVRMLNEAEAVRSAGGVIIKIIRPGTVGSDHPSDVPLPAEMVDFVIHNDSNVAGLHQKIIERAEELIVMREQQHG